MIKMVKKLAKKKINGKTYMYWGAMDTKSISMELAKTLRTGVTVNGGVCSKYASVRVIKESSAPTETRPFVVPVWAIYVRDRVS